MRRAVLLALAVALGACGGERPQGVEVTEADDEVASAPARPSVGALESAAPDTAGIAEAQRDSLTRADALRRDSLRQDSLARAEAARPDFRVFWPRFRTAVLGGRDGVAARTAFSDDLPPEAFELLYEVAFGPGPFRDGLQRLSARDFRRDGTRREAVVVVAYDADGRVVPEDEGVTESGLVLAFDVVDGAYRLVGLQLAG